MATIPFPDPPLSDGDGERREPPRRCEATGERSHAVYAWEPPGD